MQFCRRTGEVQCRHFLCDTRCIRGLCIVLRSALQGAGFQLFQRFAQGFHAEFRQPFIQFLCGFLCSNGDLFFYQHITGVQSLCHLLGSDTSFGFAVQNHPLNRGCSAVCRQQRSVEVDAAILRQFQHFFRQKLSVCQHHDQIRCQLPQRFQSCRCIFPFSQGQGLVYRNVIFQSSRFHRRGNGVVSPPLGTIRLGQNAHDFMLALCQKPQRRHCDVRRSHINDSHASSKSSGSTNSSTTSMNSCPSR